MLLVPMLRLLPRELSGEPAPADARARAVVRGRLAAPLVLGAADRRALPDPARDALRPDRSTPTWSCARITRSSSPRSAASAARSVPIARVALVLLAFAALVANVIGIALGLARDRARARCRRPTARSALFALVRIGSGAVTGLLRSSALAAGCAWCAITASSCDARIVTLQVWTAAFGWVYRDAALRPHRRRSGRGRSRRCVTAKLEVGTRLALARRACSRSSDHDLDRLRAVALPALRARRGRAAARCRCRAACPRRSRPACTT